MSADYTTWLVRALGLPLFEETPRGGVRANSAARTRLGEVRATGLADAVARCCGLAEPSAELLAAVEAARGGEAQDVRVAEFRVAIAPIAKGRASAVVVIPDAGPSIRERAAATDLAAGVSHELANALGAIAGWASLARKGGNVDEALSIIESSAESAWSVARSMLGRVSGRKDTGPAVTNASDLATQVSRLIGPRALQSRVHIERRIAEGVHVDGEHSDLWAALWNLALNAIEAMSEGGTLLVQLTATDDEAVLVVSDNGPGMSEEVQARAFEPYMTTKATGSGVGLATVKRAVLAMGGTISLESTPKRGTRFEIRLKRRAQATQAVVRRPKPDSERTSGVFRAERIEARILVVDDDAALREMTSTALTVRGADVVAVGTPHEALAADGVFDLALVDMLLPETTGDVLIKSLRAAGKAKHGLLVTGTDVAQLKLTVGGEPIGILRKPFRLDDLFDRVTEALRQAPSRTSVGAKV